MNPITAMIVDDEAPMRAHLRSKLIQTWPELKIVAEAANGIVAIEEAELHHPQIIFLDIRMPGKNGIEAASQLAKNALIIFVTAYDEYAIQAFERGAMDYLLKPIDTERLQQTCLRLQERLAEKNAESSTTSSSKTALSDKTQQSHQVEQLLTQLMQQQQA